MLKPTLAAKGQRVIACLLAAFLTCSMAPVAAFAAEEEIAEPDAVEPAADFARESGTESATDDAEESDTAAADCMSDVVDPLATDVEAIVEPVVEVNASTSIDAEAQPALGFVYIDEAAPESGSEQNIVFALSDESLRLASAILRYATLEGVFEVEARAYEDNAALFVIENLVPGEYELLGVRFAVASSDVLYEENLARGEYAFTVRSEEGLSTCEVNALSVDAAGQLEEVEVVEGAVESSLEQAPPARAAAPMASTAITDARSVGTGLIVALDPGHGGSDPGACANGLKEKDLTLSIARYCQALLQRSGISVIMTRTTDTYVGLSDRVKIAADGGATVFVSIHINSAIATTAQGCEVWVPNNSSYNNDTHVAGNGLGEKIVAKLTALGLKNRGVKTRDSENGSKYPNGSVADYYTVINGARQRGIPGIIVEHAFITNAHDAVMLASDAMLKKMGEADAQGIIEAINAGIIKGSGKLEKDSHGVKFRNPDGSLARKAWVKANGVWYYFGADGYALVGPQLIGGKRYYFNSAGQMMTGWMRNSDSTWSFYTGSGAAATGWVKSGGKWYYLDPATCRSVRSCMREIGGERYLFDGSSRMLTGWVRNSDSTWTYCTSGGIVLVGWQRIGGCWYYLYPDTAKAACGSQVIAGKAYYFNDSCQMMTGWVRNSDSTWSFYTGSGAAATGWVKSGGKWYYLDPATCRSVRSCMREIGGERYLFDGSSRMLTGWVRNSDSTWSFYTGSGAAATGWVKSGGKWYYLDPATCRSVRSCMREIGGERYLFDGSSRMLTGWVRNSDSTWTYCTSGGIVLVGWQRIGGCWYYLYPDTAKAACGSQVIAGKAYYFNDSCQMMTGWVVFADGSKSYYGPSGARVTGQAAIDGILYDFGEDGVIRNQIMGKPQTTVDAMAQDYESQVKLLKKSYPAAVYASKGAPTVRDFCQLIYDEAVHEGVRPAVLYAQVMHETGWLQFGGDVSPEQCNFGGLGATGGGNPGNQFPDVRTGLRAQVQHLKAYGSTEPLKNPCVDERFKYVQRGVAPYVADLAGKWAMDTQYGVKLNKIIDKLCG